MSDIAIRAERLGKRYRIGARQERYYTLRDALANTLSAPIHWARRHGGTEPENHIWALKDVSFEVRQGEVLGIIGRNGAGKSTLLKVLSRITEPTEGQAEIHGRVGSLLEIGTGFHPELTGRENIYLSGAILGMRKREIDRRLDEIVAFAEVEKFLDTPAKRYSSGMYMRLAFAVAAHLEPEILVVDEVLAVGDSSFQKKCLEKMDNVSRQGRTVLFVSHNMAAVQQLCQQGMVLDRGQVSFVGGIHDAIAHYIQTTAMIQTTSLMDRTDRHGSQWLKFTKVTTCDADGNELQQILSGQTAYIRFHYVSTRTIRKAKVNIAFNIRSPQGYLLANLNSVDSGDSQMDIYSSGFFQCRWPDFNLRAGSYECALYCAIDGDITDWLQSAFTLHVEDGDFFSTGKLVTRDQGDILVRHSWSGHPTLEQQS